MRKDFSKKGIGPVRHQNPRTPLAACDAFEWCNGSEWQIPHPKDVFRSRYKDIASGKETPANYKLFYYDAPLDIDQDGNAFPKEEAFTPHFGAEVYSGLAIPAK